MIIIWSSWYHHHDDMIIMISSWSYDHHDSRTIIFWPKTPQKSGPRPSNWTSLGPIRTVSMRLVVLAYSRGLGTSKMMSFFRFLCREKMKIFKNHLRTSVVLLFLSNRGRRFHFFRSQRLRKEFLYFGQGAKNGLARYLHIAPHWSH